MFCGVSLTNIVLLTIMQTRDTELSLGNTIATFFGKVLPTICLPVVLFVTDYLYLHVFPFDDGKLRTCESDCISYRVHLFTLLT